MLQPNRPERVLCIDIAFIRMLRKRALGCFRSIRSTSNRYGIFALIASRSAISKAWVVTSRMLGFPALVTTYCSEKVVE
jgi:hypothetical protein